MEKHALRNHNALEDADGTDAVPACDEGGVQHLIKVRSQTAACWVDVRSLETAACWVDLCFLETAGFYDGSLSTAACWVSADMRSMMTHRYQGEECKKEHLRSTFSYHNVVSNATWQQDVSIGSAGVVGGSVEIEEWKAVHTADSGITRWTGT